MFMQAMHLTWMSVSACIHSVIHTFHFCVVFNLVVIKKGRVFSLHIKIGSEKLTVDYVSLI